MCIRDSQRSVHVVRAAILYDAAAAMLPDICVCANDVYIPLPVVAPTLVVLQHAHVGQQWAQEGIFHIIRA
eukprot:5203581-Pyramimonas_sp.AAC.1